MELSIAGVDSFQQSARFYKDDGADFVEISFVGSKDSLVKKVSPEHMAKFKDAWDAYCDGRELEQRKGTPLTDAPMSEIVAKSYVQRNVHTLEELAMLSDAQCQALGHGTLTHRENARKLIATRTDERRQDQMKAVSKAAGTIGGAAPTADNSEVLETLKDQSQQLKVLNEGIGALVQLMTAQAQKSKPGRKPKAQG